MAQSDRIVQNATFPTVRADINDNLAALFSQNSGNSAPADPVEYQFWINTNVNPPVWNIYKGGNWRAIGTIDTTFAVGGLTAIANGGTGQTTASAAINALLPSQSGQSGKYLGTNGTVASWESILSIVAGTAVPSTSGTSIDFTGIPSWVKRITIIFDRVSLSGTNDLLVRIGDSGGLETTNYLASSATVSSATTIDTATNGFLIQAGTSTVAITGHMILTLISGSTWISSHTMLNTDAGAVRVGGGTKTLSATLDRLTVLASGANTFDAGSINILYEG